MAGCSTGQGRSELGVNPSYMAAPAKRVSFSPLLKDISFGLGKILRLIDRIDGSQV